MFVAIPTAMPDDPLTSKFGTFDGRTEGSFEELSKLGIAAHKAHKILGTSSLKLLDYADNRMDSVDLLDIVKTVEDEVKEKNNLRSN